MGVCNIFFYEVNAHPRGAPARAAAATALHPLTRSPASSLPSAARTRPCGPAAARHARLTPAALAAPRLPSAAAPCAKRLRPSRRVHSPKP